MNEQPIIGISAGILKAPDAFLGELTRAYVNEDYVHAVEAAGGIPLIIPVAASPESVARQVALCDGIIMSGGPDVKPCFYGEEPHPLLGEVNERVDIHQLALVKAALAADKPLLGICRGLQIMNVALGGTLYQDLSEFPKKVLKHLQGAERSEGTHHVSIDSGSILHDALGERILLNSYHHQCLKALGDSVKAVAWSDDRIIEAVTITGKRFAVGLQWHPEMMADCSEKMLKIFQMFVDACREETATR